MRKATLTTQITFFHTQLLNTAHGKDETQVGPQSTDFVFKKIMNL